MICTSCRYAPEEIMAGFDQECVRLDPHPVSFACAESCSHPNLCSFAKAIIEEVSRKHYEEIVLTDCSDAGTDVIIACVVFGCPRINLIMS